MQEDGSPGAAAQANLSLDLLDLSLLSKSCFHFVYFKKFIFVKSVDVFQRIRFVSSYVVPLPCRSK